MKSQLLELEKEQLADELVAVRQVAARVPELEKKNAELEFRLEQLNRLIFGSKRERFVPQEIANQLQLELGEVGRAEAPPQEEIIPEHTRRKPKKRPNHKGRNPLPDHLPREEVIIEPEQDISGMKRIGAEVSEQLEAIPAKLYVIRTVRPIYADGDCVVVAPMPGRPVDKGLFGPGLLTQIVIDKYLDHQPLYRQSQQFARQKVKIAESTLGDAIANVCKLIDQLWQAHRTETLTQPYLMVDETPQKVLDRQKDKNIGKGYQWGYYSPLTKTILFHYCPSRSRAGPAKILKNYQGFLQTDGYKVYDEYQHKQGIVVLNCMAHARRKFDQALKNHPSRAAHAMKEFAKLYEVERKAREANLDFSERKALREIEARPVWERFRDWMIAQYPDSTPQSAFGKALDYTLPRWKNLGVYLLDGRLEIDNNPIENCIRPIALGRKNYLFAGSHEGGRRAAILYSLLGTCKLQGINPHEWLKDILERIADHPVNRIQELLPQHWKPID